MAVRYISGGLVGTVVFHAPPCVLKDLRLYPTVHVTHTAQWPLMFL